MKKIFSGLVALVVFAFSVLAFGSWQRHSDDQYTLDEAVEKKSEIAKIVLQEYGLSAVKEYCEKAEEIQQLPGVSVNCTVKINPLILLDRRLAEGDGLRPPLSTKGITVAAYAKNLSGQIIALRIPE